MRCFVGFSRRFAMSRQMGASSSQDFFLRSWMSIRRPGLVFAISHIVDLTPSTSPREPGGSGGGGADLGSPLEGWARAGSALLLCPLPALHDATGTHEPPDHGLPLVRWFVGPGCGGGKGAQPPASPREGRKETLMAAHPVPAPIMPSPRRVALLALVLVATPMLAGCNFQQWARQEGTVNVFVAPLSPAKSNANDFQRLKVGIIGVSIKQVGSIDTKEFTYGSDPKIIDLVAAGRSGEKSKVASTVIPIRAVESVTVRIEVEDAVDAAGKTIRSCHP